MITKVKIKDHNKHKINLLKLIDSMPKVSFNTKAEEIDKSDWCLNSFYHRKYWDYFFNLLDPWFETMENKYGSNQAKMKIETYWFQQYFKNNFHSWHNHPRCHFSSVYYLELYKNELATEFKEFNLTDVQEGDIITFPSYLLHRSPINNYKKRKTVIVFNSTVYISE
jgi:hypothetical protein